MESVCPAPLRAGNHDAKARNAIVAGNRHLPVATDSAGHGAAALRAAPIGRINHARMDTRGASITLLKIATIDKPAIKAAMSGVSG